MRRLLCRRVQAWIEIAGARVVPPDVSTTRTIELFPPNVCGVELVLLETGGGTVGCCRCMPDSLDLRVSPNQIDLDGATTPTVSTPFFPKLHHPQNKHNKLHYLTPSMAVTINTAADLQLYVKTGLFYS